MSAVFHNPAAARPTLCTSQNSILQQERLHLLHTLAEEERRKERLNGILSKIQADLVAGGEAERTKSLQKSHRKIRSKLNKSERVEQSLSNCLEAVVERMQRLDDHQWRRAQHDYAQQTQHGLMTSLAPIPPTAWPMMQSAVVSSAMPQLYTIPQMQTMCGPSNIHSQYYPVDQALINQIPPTPVLRPMHYTRSQALSLQPFQFPQNINTTTLPNNANQEGISPTDTVSSYTLSPWTATAAPADIFPMAGVGTAPNVGVPTTQVFDLVHGVNAMDISGHEAQDQTTGIGYWVQAQPFAAALASTEGSTTGTSLASQQLQMLGGHSAALRLERKARKRQSI